MKLLPFGEYKPDVSDLVGNNTREIANVIPQADGYGPVRGVEGYADALSGPCRGAFRSLTSSGQSVVFAGTQTGLYQLNNTTLEWTDVTNTGGAYLVPGEQLWQFAQYENFVFAVQGGDTPQVFELDVDTEFSDLGGSPPSARYISIVGEFVVLSGLVSFPYRVQWSGRSSPTTWTSGTLESDFQDFGDGGPVSQIGGGEGSTLVLQDSAMRRMTYQPGSPVIFSFERVSENIGLATPYSLVKSSIRAFFFSNAGFQMSINGGDPISIGKEIVDETFLNEWDDDHPELCQGFIDPTATRVLFAYKTQSSDQTDRFNKILVYDWALERWSPITGIEAQYAAPLSQAAATLEGLDDIAYVFVTGDTTSASAIVTDTDTSNMYEGMTVTGADIPASTTIDSIDSATQFTMSANATGTTNDLAIEATGSLDSITVASLDAFTISFGREVSIFDTSNVLGFLTGPTLEATLETPEQGEAKTQMRVNGLHPVTDAESVFGCASHRIRIGAPRVYLTEQPMNSEGFVPQRIETRYSRSKVRIPAGQTWNFASGVLPDYTETGNR